MIKNDCVTERPEFPTPSLRIMIHLVYIGATWCGPCRIVKPRIEELCKKFGISYKLRDYDSDLNDDEKDVITKIPTIQIYEDDRIVAEYTTNQVVQTEAWLQEHVTIGVEDDDF